MTVRLVQERARAPLNRLVGLKRKHASLNKVAAYKFMSSAVARLFRIVGQQEQDKFIR